LWQEAQGNPPQRTMPQVQEEFRRTGEIPQARPWQTPAYPGSPIRQFLGGALQAGSAAIPPLMEASGVMRGMQAGGLLSRVGARAIPTMAESATAMGGSAAAGGNPQDVIAAGSLPIAMRLLGAPVAKILGRSFAESVMPDQVRDAVARNIEQRFGPPILPKKLWEEHINPNQGLFLPSTNTTAYIKQLDIPEATSFTNARLASDIRKTLQKYADPSTMTGRSQMTLPGSQGVFGQPENMRTLGNMYDDMNKIDTLASLARKEGMKYYATKLYGVKDAMLDDMINAVPKLADARAATWKQGNVTRLWDVMTAGKPIDEWRVASKEPWVTKAFSESEKADIYKTMDQMARLGGGEHWVGRILGHAALGAVGAGGGAMIGGPQGGVIGGAAGVLMPHVLGLMMSNAGGRAYMRGLMKKYPTGLTSAGANAAMQWYLAATQTGSLAESPSGQVVGSLGR